MKMGWTYPFGMGWTYPFGIFKRFLLIDILIDISKIGTNKSGGTLCLVMDHKQRLLVLVRNKTKTKILLT